MTALLRPRGSWGFDPVLFALKPSFPSSFHSPSSLPHLPRLQWVFCSHKDISKVNSNIRDVRPYRHHSVLTLAHVLPLVALVFCPHVAP